MAFLFRITGKGLPPQLSGQLFKLGMRSYSASIPSHQEPSKVSRLVIPQEVQPAFASSVREQTGDPRELKTDIPEYADQMAWLLKRLLPDDIAKEFEKIEKTKLASILEVENLPIDDHIPSGTDIKERTAEKGIVSQSALLGLTKLMGYTPIRDNHENNGSAVQDVAVLKEQRDTESGRGNKKFPWHVDLAYTGNPHDLSGLTTLVGNKALTGFIYADDILKALAPHPDIIQAARENDFLLKKDPSLPENAEGQMVTRSPLLTTDQETGQDLLSWYSGEGKMEGLSDDAKRVITTMKKVIASLPAHVVGLEKTGQTAFWPNRQAIHSRLNEINEDRWLQRVYANPTETSTEKPTRAQQLAEASERARLRTITKTPDNSELGR